MNVDAVRLSGATRRYIRLSARYSSIRAATEALAAPLSPEDCQIQSMADASPTKWHLAHTAWFFETFVLKSNPGYKAFHPAYEHLYNSYYNAVGELYPRAKRGLITRPTLGEVLCYRRHVDEAMLRLLDDPDLSEAVMDTVELGLNHEQQHQELILTDIKHALWCNPLHPIYRPNLTGGKAAPTLAWQGFDESTVRVGAGDDGFAFDNERPRHRSLSPAFELATRLVTNGEYLEFINDGGYENPLLWLSDGWATIQAQGWRRPLYWSDDMSSEFTLAGDQPFNPAAPVCHLSLYEADAFARWSGYRLPTEVEWERAASGQAIQGNLVESDRRHPAAAKAEGLTQMFGDVWEWTSSAYSPYPGYRPAAGAIGEYNGKFMCSQLVLRGGSCATPATHIRSSYRNFFPPSARWQFSGLRLARDA